MKKLLIKHALVRLVQDNYNTGENPDTETEYERTDLKGLTFANVEELGKILSENLTSEDVVSFERRILITHLVDESECTLSSAEMEAWKKDQFNAYSRTIDLWVAIIDEIDATPEETAKLLNIQEA